MGSWRRWRRWGAVLLILGVALPAAVVVGKGGEAGPVPERDTSCWPCHVGWAPPLKTFYDIIPPAEAGAAVGEEFEYVVRVQGVWAPPGDGPYLRLVAPTLDLSNAPSLQFAGGPDPIPALELRGLLEPNPPSIPPPLPGTQQGPFAQGFVSQLVPDGMTFVRLTVAPVGLAPEQTTLTVNLYTGTTEPAGAPKRTERAPAPGAPVELLFDGPEAVAAVGTGNWTIQAQADTAQDYGLPGSVDGREFVVVLEARAETGGLRALPLAFAANVAKGSSYLFTYGLKAGQAPSAGESVALLVNTTVWYNHDDAGTDDYSNVTKAYGDPLPVQQNATDGRVVVIGPQTAGAVPAPFNGWSLDTLSEAIGYASAFLLVSSIWTGGMFGKASRRQLNTVFGSAKRRVAFHNFLSYGIILAASVHTVLFIVETAYYWTLGVLWGGLAILAMFGLGLTGAFQVGLIRRWNYATWRWSHYGLAVASILFTLVHMALDGVHFAFVQESIDWTDPLDPRDTTG